MDSSVLRHPVRIPSRLAAPRSFMYLIGYSTEARLHDSAKTIKHPTLLTPLHTIWRARGQHASSCQVPVLYIATTHLICSSRKPVFLPNYRAVSIKFLSQIYCARTGGGAWGASKDIEPHVHQLLHPLLPVHLRCFPFWTSI